MRSVDHHGTFSKKRMHLQPVVSLKNKFNLLIKENLMIHRRLYSTDE